MKCTPLPIRTFALWIGIMAFVLLQGCGGGGTRGTTLGGGGDDDGNATPQAERIELLPSPSSVPSTGGTSSDIEAIVADEDSNALSAKAVTFTLVDPAGTATLSFPDGRETDDEGKVTARLNIGSNKSNRTITVTARADNTSRNAAIDVTGTDLTISGATSLVLGATTVLDISLKDSGGNAIPSAPITVTSSSGNSLSATNLVTSAAGQTQVTVTGTIAGTDTIQVAGFGASASTVLSVSGSNFTFVSPTPAGNADIDVDSTATVRARWIENGTPQAGRNISFTATRGTLSSSTATTNASGEATVTISSASTGPTIVTATAPNGSPTASLSFNFTTDSAQTINLQADRNTVPVNDAGGTTNRATLTATVRDNANNLVKNARVAFTQVADPSNGSLSTSVDTTDADGKATVDYIAGPQTSGQNEVRLKATVLDVNGTPVGPPTVASPELQLTVGGQALFIRMETDNNITKDTATATYRKNYVAIVTDAAGNARNGVNVQFKINPAQPTTYNAYFKGDYTLGGGTTPIWVRRVTASCDNEDTNLNGILDVPPTVSVKEDNNGSQLLEPGNVASASSNVTTNAQGLALTEVVYPQGFANWVQVSLEAKVQVAGTESIAVRTFVLPIASTDLTTTTVNPPGNPSPFGTGSSCGDTL